MNKIAFWEFESLGPVRHEASAAASGGIGRGWVGPRTRRGARGSGVPALAMLLEPGILLEPGFFAFLLFGLKKRRDASRWRPPPAQ